MIKIFGKYRYHWQPELEQSIIYWSLSFVCLFLSLALFFETSHINVWSTVLLGVFMVAVVAGMHRYFTMDSKDLVISTAAFWKAEKIAISSIEKLEIRQKDVTIYSTNYPQGRTFRMRKWPKKYFINALSVQDAFRGEVELSDHMVALDYFEVYYGHPKKSLFR